MKKSITPSVTPYKERLRVLKIETVMAAVYELLASKGFDAMTVDEVAATAGMAKASLYKLYPSKELLAGAAMVQVMDLALALVDKLRADDTQTDVQKLKTLTRWAMQTKLEGQMPSLPAQNSKLSEALTNNEAYMQRLFELSMKLGVWVSNAQDKGHIRSDLPADFVLYNLYARACDPVLDVMKRDAQQSNEQILDWMITLQFEGLASRKS